MTNEGLVHDREQLYDPGRMQQLGGAIRGLCDRIEEFAHSQCDYVYCISTPEATLTAYELIETPNMVRHYSTAIQIDHISYEPPITVRDKYMFRIWLWNSLNEDISWAEYVITAGDRGESGIRTIQSYDGLAEAVRQEDSAFLRAVKWREASEYEARLLYEDLEELTLPAASSADTDKMV
jgi:hypothetical protein